MIPDKEFEEKMGAAYDRGTKNAGEVALTILDTNDGIALSAMISASIAFNALFLACFKNHPKEAIAIHDHYLKMFLVPNFERMALSEMTAEGVA